MVGSIPDGTDVKTIIMTSKAALLANKVRGLERSDSKSNVLPTHITNDFLLVTSSLAFAPLLSAGPQPDSNANDEAKQPRGPAPVPSLQHPLLPTDPDPPS